MTDPISDFLTRIRNAGAAGKTDCVIGYSRMKAELARILTEEGFISGCDEDADERGHKILRIRIKFVSGRPAITGIKRSSSPGRRLYFPSTDIPRVLNGLGIGILTTSRGLMKDQDARRNKIGGELICTVW